MKNGQKPGKFDVARTVTIAAFTEFFENLIVRYGFADH